jgi:hypothetical protein
VRRHEVGEAVHWGYFTRIRDAGSAEPGRKNGDDPDA